tara:strand:+ start:478 stop:1230 length:753 start_codon:yes stop_codon:yes gene_type:complete
MKFRSLVILFILNILSGCVNDSPKSISILDIKPERKYNNAGFALIYNKNLNIKEIDNRSLKIFHKNLKKKSMVKITNPLNGKSIIAEVKSNKVKFSNFYNSVITDRIVESLELDINEPYIEIKLISQNSTFIAKKAKTFDEEKKVAEKAPIDGIKISNLNGNLKKKIKKNKNEKFSYSIKIADFYYKKTAILMIEKIKNETTIKDIKLIRLSKTNYRVLLGPFNDINSLKETFEKMNSIYFENLEILKNV